MTEQAHPFTQAIAIATTLYSDEELAAWLNLPQPMIDGMSPTELLAAGRSQELLNVLRCIDEGTYL